MKALLTLRVFTLIPHNQPIKGDSSAGNPGDELGIRLIIHACRDTSIPALTEPNKMPVRLNVWLDDNTTDCDVTSVSWELVEGVLVPHIECQCVDELHKDSDSSFEQQLEYHSGEGKEEITKRLIKQGFVVEKEIGRQTIYQKSFSQVMEEVLAPIPILEVADRGRGLKEPAQLNAQQVTEVLSLYNPLTKVGRSMKKLLIENKNHPTKGVSNDQAAINKKLSQSPIDGLKLILCTSRFKSQLWVLK